MNRIPALIACIAAGPAMAHPAAIAHSHLSGLLLAPAALLLAGAWALVVRRIVAREKVRK